MADLETVNVRRDGAAATIELNRPETLNAWNAQLGHDLLAAVTAVAQDDGVRAVVLTGAEHELSRTETEATTSITTTSLSGLTFAAGGTYPSINVGDPSGADLGTMFFNTAHLAGPSWEFRNSAGESALTISTNGNAVFNTVTSMVEARDFKVGWAYWINDEPILGAQFTAGTTTLESSNLNRPGGTGDVRLWGGGANPPVDYPQYAGENHYGALRHRFLNNDGIVPVPVEDEFGVWDTTGLIIRTPLFLAADPIDPLGAATKQYVDANAGGGGLDQATADGLYANIAGDTFTGPVTLSGPPTLALHAATMAYVDAAVGAGGGGTITGVTAGAGLTGGGTTGTVTVSLTTPVTIALGGTNAIDAPTALANLGGLSQATADTLYLPLSTDLLTQAEADALYLNISTGDYLTTAEGNAAYLPIATDLFTQAEADLLYMPIASDFLTQAEADALYLTPAAAAAAYLPITTDLFTQTEADALYLPLATDLLTPAEADAAYARLTGAAFTGAVSVAADPVNPLELATKAYVDAQAGAGGGGTITGVTAGPGLTGGGVTGTVTLGLTIPVAIASGGTNAIDAATALTNLGGISQTAADARYLGIATDLFTQAEADLLYMPIASDFLTQAEADLLYLTPAAAAATYLPITTDLFTQAEADALFLTPAEADLAYLPIATDLLTQAEADARYVGLAGSTMTGALTLSGPPTAANHAATMAYVDAQVGGGLTQAEADLLYLPIATDLFTQAEADALFLTPAEGNAAYLPLTTDLFTQAEADLLYMPIASDFLTQAEGDARYLAIATDLFTQAEADALFLTPAEGNAAYLPIATDLFTQAEADLLYMPLGTGGLDQAAADALYVNIAGDVMTGPLDFHTLAATPYCHIGKNALHEGGELQLYGTPTTGLFIGASPVVGTVPASATINTFGGLPLNLVVDLTDTVATLTATAASFLKPLTVNAVGSANAVLAVNKTTDPASSSLVWGRRAGENRWALALGNSTPESAADVGSDFELHRWGDDGTTWSIALTINRATGAAVFENNITANGGVLTLAAVSPTITPTQPSIVATLGSLQIFAPTVGIYFSEINTGVDWMWINEGGLMNATGVYHGISSLGTPTTGGPLIYMHVDQSVFTLGSGVVGGGTSINPDFVWRDFAANQLMGLNNEGDLNLFTPGPTPRKYMTMFTDILSGTYSSIDIYGDTGPNYGATIQAGSGGASLISWNYVTLAHPPLNFMHGLGISMSLSTTQFQSNKEAYKPVAGPWLGPSDIRMKQNVADYTAGLAAILQLRPVTYQFNGLYGSEADGATHIGLVADEVLPVMPEMVGETQRAANPPPVMVSRDGNDLPPFIPAPAPDPASLDTIKTLDVGPLTYAIVNALKEIDARLAALEGTGASPREGGGGGVRAAATSVPPAPVPAPTARPAAPAQPRPTPPSRRTPPPRR